MITTALTLHILGAVVWVGGMFAAYVCLRPAAGALEPPQRLKLWRGFFARILSLGLGLGRAAGRQRLLDAGDDISAALPARRLTSTSCRRSAG